MHIVFFFFFNDTATTEIYTLSLHDALPISVENLTGKLLEEFLIVALVCTVFLFHLRSAFVAIVSLPLGVLTAFIDRKSTRLNSSHSQISYAVFCLKKKITRSSNTSSDCTLS